MGKYNIPKSELNRLYAVIDMTAKEYGYHNIYKELGEEQDESNKNFKCWNASAHSGGTDNNGSLHISNENGAFRCYSCGIKGNLNKYYKEYHNDKSGAFIEYMIDTLGLQRYIPDNDNDDKNIELMKKLHKAVQMKYQDKFGSSYVSSEEVRNMVKEDTSVDIEINNKYVKDLIDSKEMTDYLAKTRNISKDEIEKYRIGYCAEKRCLTFPIINSNGLLTNIKGYNPLNPKYKWIFFYKGYPVTPTPINNFTGSKIYIYEGEPDCYCAISFGYNAVTFGSVANADINKYFSPEQCDQLFGNKEIVICLDSDETGVEAAKKLASQLYPYAKQIKIINLDKSKINPYGLDPDNVKEEADKKKRVEKDFTDFMKKNGFNENAKELFDVLERDTLVYTENKERIKRENYKVTLQEARSSRYFSTDGNIELELVGSVSDWDTNSYKYPTEFLVTCNSLVEGKMRSGACKSCIIPKIAGFENEGIREHIFKFVGKKKSKDFRNDLIVEVDEHNILGLIEVKDSLKQNHQKKLARINEKCSDVIIKDLKVNGLMHIRISRDITESVEISDSNVGLKGGSDFSMDAYMLEKDIHANKSYKFKAVQTTSWNTGHSVLFVYEAIPMQTSIDKFTINDESNEILCMFKPKEGQSIQEHLTYRYNVFGNAAGINDRDELFFMMDLAFFGQTEIHNEKVLPGISRGWVEVLIAGDPRCGKSVIAKFLHKHYKIGELIGGSSAVTRTGLVGGITFFKQKASIKWGQIPQNDGGIVIIDELSQMCEKELSDMNFLRSEGVATLAKIEHGTTSAKVNKIFLSNERAWKNEEKRNHSYGIQMIRDLCFTDMALARFDLATVVKKDDVKDFAAQYDKISTEFTEFQCQTLIKWAYSRTYRDIVFEEGFENLVKEKQEFLLTKFHDSTQLINQEMRAKLTRLATSLAAMLFSTPKDELTKIFVKKEHVEYIVDFMMKLYSHKNMGMDLYSELKWKSEKLGNMEFMANILKYVNVDNILSFTEGTEKDICNYYMDYLTMVMDRDLYIIKGNDDKSFSYGQRIYELTPRFIGLLLARNCIKKTNRGRYMKTEQFSRWLKEFAEHGIHNNTADVLEVESNKHNIKSAKNIK